MAAQTLVVGFDLDMTLIDSRPGIATTLQTLADEAGEPDLRDPGLLDALLRSNLDLEFAHRFAATRAQVLGDRFRDLYATIGVNGCTLLPGAVEALAATRRAGARAIVVTAKYEPNAHLCLAHVGLVVDEVFGWRFGPGKAETLAEHGATVYVGDTPRDVEAARTAGAAAVGVTTGPHDARELHTAGADVVLSSLAEFPAWWEAHRVPS